MSRPVLIPRSAFQAIGRFVDRDDMKFLVSDWSPDRNDPLPPDLPTDPLWCPECKMTSQRSEWIETEVPCETCGDHSALQCPRCDEIHDIIFVELGPAPEGEPT